MAKKKASSAMDIAERLAGRFGQAGVKQKKKRSTVGQLIFDASRRVGGRKK